MKQLTAFLLVFSLLFVSMPQKSHAVVGVVIQDKTTRTIGAIVTAVSGVTATATIYALGATGAYFSGAAALILLSVPGVAIGLIILDEKNADLKFKPLTQDMAGLLGLTEEELDVYNSEVDELNVIKAEVEEQISDNVTDEEIAQLWTEYGRNLSPETMSVAAKVITKTFEARNK